jgi:hypothetical protein
LFEFPPFAASQPRRTLSWFWAGFSLLIIAYQFAVYVNKDIVMVRDVMARENDEQSLVFYKTIENDYLPLIKAKTKLEVFRDVRMYFPASSRWIVRSYWNSNYSIIEKTKPDIIILWAQRIGDYTKPGAQESAVDPVTFQDMFQFYVDADRDQLRGYKLIYRNEEGLFFVTNDLYQEFFKN